MESASSLAEAPAISPDFVGLPPRKIELTGNGIVLAIVTAVIIAGAVIWTGILAIEGVQQFQIRSALRGAGTETIGNIERLRNPLKGLKEHVDYTFIADGKIYSGEAIVPLEDYHTIRLAGTLSIRYLPDDPAVNHPADWEWSALQEFEAYFVLIVLIALGCIVFVLPQMLLARKLAVEGEASVGVVTKCSVSGRGGQFVKLKYDFRTRDDILIQGRGDFKTEKEIGAKILVLYLPQNPRKNVPFLLAAWHIANR